MIVYFTSTSNVQAVEFAKHALRYRLYVSSWQLNGTLHEIINSPDTMVPMISLAYCNITEKYVGVAVKTKSGCFKLLQAFVRNKRRGQGIGKELVKLLGGVVPGTIVGPGVVGATDFWNKCATTTTTTEEEQMDMVA